jgi:oligoendopeptidase F
MGLKMKLNALIAITALLLVSTLSNAQVTDTELKSYIMVIDSIKTLKDQLTAKMNQLATGNGKVSPGRFNSLMPIIENQTKLADLKATPEEIAYVKKAAAIRDEETRKFQQAYQSLITNDIGNDVFTKVRNALKSDTTLKKRYDSLMVKPIRP